MRIFSTLFLVITYLSGVGQIKVVRSITKKDLLQLVNLLPNDEKANCKKNILNAPKDLATLSWVLNTRRIYATDSIDLSKVIAIYVYPSDDYFEINMHTIGRINLFYAQDSSLPRVSFKFPTKTYFYFEKNKKVFFEKADIHQYKSKKLFQLQMDSMPNTIYKDIPVELSIELGNIGWDRTILSCTFCNMITNEGRYTIQANKLRNVIFTIQQQVGKVPYLKTYTLKALPTPKEKRIN